MALPMQLYSSEPKNRLAETLFALNEGSAVPEKPRYNQFLQNSNFKTLYPFSVEDSEIPLLAASSVLSGGQTSLALYTDTNTGQVVLCKCPKLTDPESNNSLEREGNLLQQLNHQAFPSFIDFVNEDGEKFLIMEYFTGINMRVLFGVKSFIVYLTPENIKNISLQIASGLDYLHSVNCYHRDIKPANIVLVFSGDKVDVKIIDLGNSNLVNPELGVTPGFSCREQNIINLSSEADVNPLIFDNYSTLSLVFAMFTGEIFDFFLHNGNYNYRSSGKVCKTLSKRFNLSYELANKVNDIFIKYLLFEGGKYKEVRNGKLVGTVELVAELFQDLEKVLPDLKKQ